MHRKECELIRFVLFLLFVCFSSVKWLFDSSSFQNWSAKCWPEGSFQHYGPNHQILSKKYEVFLTSKSRKVLFMVYKEFPNFNLVSFSTEKITFIGVLSQITLNQNEKSSHDYWKKIEFRPRCSEHRSVFVGFDPIIESEVPEKRPLGPAPNGRKVILIVPKLQGRAAALAQF